MDFWNNFITFHGPYRIKSRAALWKGGGGSFLIVWSSLASFLHITPVHLQPHLRSSTPAQGLCRRTCTSMWPEPPEGWLRSNSHSAGSQRQTELFSSPSPPRSPGWTAALAQMRGTKRQDYRQHPTHDLQTDFAPYYWILRNLNRLVNSLLYGHSRVNTLYRVIKRHNSCQSRSVAQRSRRQADKRQVC